MQPNPEIPNNKKKVKSNNKEYWHKKQRKPSTDHAQTNTSGQVQIMQKMEQNKIQRQFQTATTNELRIPRSIFLSLYSLVLFNKKIK